MKSVKTYTTIDEIEQARWDAIVDKDDVFCSHGYVRALERSGVNKGRCYYPVVYDGDDIIAHASIYFISEELDLFARGIIRDLIRLIRRKWKNFLVLRMIECGPPIALGSTISVKNGADSRQALEELCGEVERLAKELDAKLVLFRDFYDDEAGSRDFLEKRGYKKIHNLPKAHFKVRWKSFGEYLDSMRSAYRCKIVKNMDKCSKANISLGTLTERSGDRALELKRLYDNVYDQAKEVKRERLPEAYFRNIDANLGDKAVILSATKDDKLIGYMFLLMGGKTLISAFPGLDYNYSKEYCVYFNLFYKTIELAIEKGIENIDMGITTLDPKRDLGSDVVSLNMYMKHSNPLLDRVLPVLFDMITPPDTTVPRNVFKK